MPKISDPENETGTPDEETELGWLEIVGLFASVLLLAALVCVLFAPPTGLL